VFSAVAGVQAITQEFLPMLRNKQLSLSKSRSARRRSNRASLVASLFRKPRLEMLETRALLAANPLTSIPVLNSNPAASAALYLDFNGHFEATWGTNSNITTPVFDRDGDYSTFSEDELAFMTDVWKVVAEDYAPFNINVTTVEPAVLAPGVPASQANGVALRVAIGGSASTSGISSAGSLGVAYPNSFTSSIANVAYVFPIMPGGSNTFPTHVGGGASHEAGHSFGLYHQSSTGTEAIMFGSSGGEDERWVLGTNQYGYVQDDMAVLSNSLNGFGYRADDFGGSISNATPLVDSNGAMTGSGIIGSASDVDMFSFTTPGANGVKIDVQGSVIGQNLDVVFDLLDAAGNVIGTANPTDSLDATLILPSSGMRYLAVRSTGVYGRVGQYTISVSPALQGVEVVAGKSGLSTSEQGLSDSFTVRLTSKPAADVTINVSSSDESEGIVSPGQIVFTADNWYLPQTAVVSGVDDFSVDGISAYSINFDSVSADTNYAGMSIASLQASNADNDVPGSSVQLGGSQADIKIDQQGNLIVTGNFSIPTDFDPGPGVTLLTPGGARDGYIAKYSPTYELIWAKSFVATSNITYSYSLDLDTAGNIYVAGTTYAASTAFGDTVLTNPSSGNAYLTKLDSTGDFLWARGWGGTLSGGAHQVRVGSNGNIIVGGSYQGTMDANPGSGTFTITSAGSYDSYVSQFTPAGLFISSTSLGGTEQDFLRQLEVDNAGNIYAAGYFYGTGQFGSQTLTSTGSSDQFLMKMNHDGSIEWARQVAGLGLPASVAGLAVDANGSVYLAAAFTGDINFGPGTPTLTDTGTRSSYLAKWDSSGTLQRADQFSGDDKVSILGMEIGADGNLNLFGYLQGTADLDPGPGEAIRTSSGVQDSIILRLDANHQFLDLVQIARASGNIAALDVDARGNVIVAGAFGGGAPVKLPTGDVFDGSNGDGYMYLLKLNIAAGVTVGPSVGLVTSEDGTSTNFNVVLDIPPTADVTIPVSSSDSNEGVVSTSSLTFTPANWNVPQTVVVTGVDDTAIDGDKSYSIVLGPATSTDPAYDGLDANDLSVTNADNDQPLVMFSDSFEVGEWNGLWVEDSQNDWFRSTQRATDGSWAAEVDGSANNATLTIGSAINLSGMQTATLTFDWLIESGFDAGEYLSLDISTNGGSSWIQDVRRLSGNVDTENVWHNETVDLSAYSSSNLKIRFRSKVSASDEDANVDNVRITAIPAGPNTPPVAVAGGPYAVNEGGSVTLSASGSSDNDGTISNYAWDFDGDGQYDDASGASVDFATNQSGSHVIGLQVTDNRGATATTTTTVGVNNVAPTASAGVDQSSSKGAVVNLSAASSTDPGNDIVSYAWDLNGNGQYSDASGASATFSSAVAGVFTVSVKVTDADGAVSFDSATITVSDASTKFYVVNDASTDATYEYAADGSSIENYAINSGNSSPRGAASTAAGTTVWVADKNRKVFVYDTAGGMHGSWTAGTLSSKAQVEGLATNGTDVWIVDNRSDTVYRYAGAAGRLSGSQTAASSFSLNTSNTNPKGIVTDGTYVWVVNDSTTDKVFKYTLSGSLVGSWTIDPGSQTPTGLTIDPANGSQSIWIVDSGTDRVYEYDAARGRTSGSQAAGITFALASVNSNPQGIADPPPPVKLAAEPQRSSAATDGITTMIASPSSLVLKTDRGLRDEPQDVSLSIDQAQHSNIASRATFTDNRDHLSGLVAAKLAKVSSASDVDDLFASNGTFESIDDGLLAILAQPR